MSNRQDDRLDPEVSDNAAYLAGAAREKLIPNKIDVSFLLWSHRLTHIDHGLAGLEGLAEEGEAVG
jgi:hypothetical protein